MKIVHYIPSLSPRFGGIVTYIQLLSKELGKQCDLTVVTRPFDDSIELQNCKIVNLPAPMLKFKKAWREFLNTHEIDIVHINGIWQPDTWWIQKEALKRGIKTYITPHGMLEPWIINHNHWKKVLALALYEKKALKKATNLIATAESEKKNIVNLGVTKNNIPIISNGIDVSCIKLKNNWIKRKKILYISRIHVKKGIELLIDTLVGIKDKVSDYEIIIAGEGDTEYVNSLKAKALQSKLNVKFVGGVYGDKKWEVFQDADFFVLPTHSENFGYVIAESLASGTPVITTKGAPWEDIETHHCGRWIERTEEGLKEAIIDMMFKNSNELELMGRNGRQLIEEKYSAKVMADELMKLYLLNDTASG